MDDDQLRSWIADGRRSLAGALDRLTDEQWHGPSLCEGWSVAHVVAHVVMPFRYTTAQVLWGVVRAGGRFGRYSDGIAARDARLPRDELVGTLRDNAEHPWAPPGGGLLGALTHDTVHGLDVTYPAGTPWRPADHTLAAVLDASVAPRSLRHFGVSIAGLQLEATDVAWSHVDATTGAGGAASVRRDRATDLLLFLTGRAVRVATR